MSLLLFVRDCAVRWPAALLEPAVGRDQRGPGCGRRTLGG